ncbi:sensor histidine kinase [Glaciibacter superstes]|uniref:sensor histidine kinase n=1 Tax=Glaciibacter superstes TaxID=501023 RepID=UPI0003B7B3B3|nr:HAMP domain-containing sensor histidine kinase [Glaciibacter superstes]
MPSSRLPRWSVRTRILAAILAVTALSMAGAGFTAYLVQRDRVMHEIDDRLLSRVEAVRVVVSGSPATDVSGTEGSAPAPSSHATTREALEAVFSRVLPGRNESSLGVIDGKPALVSAIDVDAHLEEDPALVDRIVAEVSDGTVRLGTSVGPLGSLRYVATPVNIEGDPQQGLYIAAFDIDAELKDSISAFSTYAIVAAGGLVAVGLVGWLVAGRLLRPLRDLRDAASRISATDLTKRIPVQGNDDLSGLTSTVNTMLDRIDGAVSAQKQLLNDVRHELKTPITIVRGQLEVANPEDPDDMRQAIAIAIDELDRMSALVDEIESLADSQQSLLNRSPIDIRDFTEQVFAKASTDGNHKWNLAEFAEVACLIDSARITQAWLQLADNAGKYAPPGSPISLGSRITDGQLLEFWVADQGPGIPKDMEDRIFDRFGRVGAQRGVRGSGLGLPIVAAIAKAHGGRVALQSSPVGSRFAIEIPLQEANG